MTGLLLAFTFLVAFGGVVLLLAPSEALRLARTLGPLDPEEEDVPAEPLSRRLLGPPLARLRAALYARTPRGMREVIEASLAAAGRPADVGALMTRKAILGGVLGVGSWLLLAPRGPFPALLAAAVTGFAGWRLPDIGLMRLAARRRLAIARVLPDAMDLLCTSVEAGLALDGAIQKVAEKMGGPLTEELAIYLREVRLGRPREEALRDVAARAGLPELRSAVAAIIQSERLGGSLARVLRVQAADLRQRRRLAARERAMRIPILLLVPLVGFIFPAIFIVVLGPAVLEVLHSLRLL